MTMKMAILTITKGNIWCIGRLEIKHDSGLVVGYSINQYYEVTPDWFIIFSTEGGSGTGFRRGQMTTKIFIGDCEFLTREE